VVLEPPIEPARRTDVFVGRVAVLFGTDVFAAIVGIVNGILLARLLGPAAKGDYYIVVLVPTTAMVLIQLGLPQAFGYYAARAQTAGIFAKALVLTAVLATATIAVLVLILPFLREAFLHDIPLGEILLAFAALPLALSATFMASIVMGRQAVRWYAVVNAATPVATTVLLVLILGGLGPSVGGAIAVWLLASTIKTIMLAVGTARVTNTRDGSTPATYRGLFRFAMPYYPGSLTEYFSARLDVYLIAWLIAKPAADLGYYSMAVGLAELVFFFPNAVANLFFPHVAGSTREDSDRQVTMVSRVALVVSAGVALALVPAGAVMITILLPAFGPSLPALYVLLPAVVTLSVTKVVGGYLTGIGRPALNSWINISAAVVNVVANLILIPRLGIVGAATASLVSYTMSSVLMTVIVARLSHQPTLDFWAVRAADVRFTFAMSLSLIGRIRRAAAARAR
jgi:O-antigen/teichoic acid export membrane protein